MMYYVTGFCASLWVASTVLLMAVAVINFAIEVLK